MSLIRILKFKLLMTHHILMLIQWQTTLNHTKRLSLLWISIFMQNLTSFATLLSLGFKLIKFSVSAICIQETWLRNDQDTSHFEIPAYNRNHKGQGCSEHGGLIIHLKVEFTHNYRKLSSQSNPWAGLFIDVFNEHINKKITIGNIYRPPRLNNSNSTIEDFMLELIPAIDKLSTENSYAIFAGDFNINLLEINTILNTKHSLIYLLHKVLYKNCTTHKIHKKEGSNLNNIFAN